MTDARNVYPRLCWTCLGVIEDYEHDHALMTYGGYCADCHEHQRPYRPEVDVALRGQTERMNNVSEREELLREAYMSDNIDNQVEQMLLGESEQDTGEHPAMGGVIENGGIAMAGNGEPELLFPQGASANITKIEPGKPITMVPGQPYSMSVKFDATATNSYWNTNAAASSWMYPAYVPPMIYAQPAPDAEPLTPERIEELMSKQHIQVTPAPTPLTDEIRAFIREEVHRTIYPTAEMVNPHEHRRIEMTEESGRKWRGVLYLVEKESEL